MGIIHGGRLAMLALICMLLFNHAVLASGEDELTVAAQSHRQPIHFNGEMFSGPGYETLLDEGRQAHFFLIGEEHGIAENPLLAAQLFRDLAEVGYRRLAIEISPPMADAVDQALADGLDGLRALYAEPGGEPAFFGMQQEAELLATIRAAVPEGEPALWGCDYEVAGDRTLLRRLSAIGPPPGAHDAFDALVRASDTGWSQWAETGNPQFVFSFSGAPELVANLRKVWPERNAEVNSILDTLEQTLIINRFWTTGQGYASNVQRGALLRKNFLAHWQTLPPNEPKPRVMAKFGASHLLRGLNTNHSWDLGALIPELAQIEGRSSVSVLVLPGVDSDIARFDPTRWSYVPAPAKDGYANGLEPIVDAAFDDQFTLIHLAPLRPRIIAQAKGLHSRLLQMAMGFDYVLIMSGSTPADELVHP
ncbi:MAG: hypothetical protein AAF446_02995 [Pseudomonadota bacterium]